MTTSVAEISHIWYVSWQIELTEPLRECDLPDLNGDIRFIHARYSKAHSMVYSICKFYKDVTRLQVRDLFEKYIKCVKAISPNTSYKYKVFKSNTNHDSELIKTRDNAIVDKGTQTSVCEEALESCLTTEEEAAELLNKICGLKRKLQDLEPLQKELQLCNKRLKKFIRSKTVN